MRFVLVAVWLALSAPVWGWKAPGQAYVRSQVSGWLDLIDEDDFSQNRFGVRYLPELSLRGPEVKGIAVDGELALGGRIGGRFHSPGGKTDAYRFWARFSGAQWEMRAGLQKINFGTATLLRPLRWFDRIDPRDPLELTRGVGGMLGRYYFLNNANLWLWMVRGGGNTGGGDLLPSEDGTWELGGRGQTPAGPGEIGVTVHTRKVAAGLLFPGEVYGGFPEDETMRETSLDFFEKQYPAAMGYFPDGVLTEEGLAAIEAAGEPFREWRLGLDGQWDREIGLWMEGMVVHQDAPRPLFKYLQMTTVGADYTLGIGSGLHVLGEHLVSRSYNLLPVYTVYENVELPLLLLKTPAAQRRQSVLQSLEWVGLTDKLESRPSQLSGGECQRVSIARAMVKTPEIVLADEPTANLDARNSHNILQTMEKLNRDLHTTFIFATHDEKVIQYLRRKIS